MLRPLRLLVILRMSLGVPGRVYGGEGGIRTPDSLATMSDFESGAFNRALPPLRVITAFRRQDYRAPETLVFVLMQRAADCSFPFPGELRLESQNRPQWSAARRNQPAISLPGNARLLQCGLELTARYSSEERNDSCYQEHKTIQNGSWQGEPLGEMRSNQRILRYAIRPGVRGHSAGGKVWPK